MSGRITTAWPALGAALADATDAAELSAIDLRFADLIGRLAPAEHATLLAMTAALVSRERGHGHSCVVLARFERASLVEAEGEAGFPAVEQWEDALRASGLVGDGSTPTPMVLEGGRCYLRRYWQAERRLAQRLLRCAAEPAETLDADRGAELLSRLFGAGGLSDAQAQAAAATLRNRLTVVSGGPGTGKTTTVGRILALLRGCRRELRIELAAPTGKAAARLTESIRAQAGDLPVEPELRTAIGDMEARTIHRLLGARPRRFELRYDASRPLPCDVLVVDEASMVDLLTMDALLAALPAHARLLLVGDKDQLASVDAGFVFGDLCEAATAAPATSSLRNAAVELTHVHRFRERSGIADAAAAVRECDADRALAVLDAGDVADAVHLDLPASAAAIARTIEDEIAAVVEAEDPLAALERLGHVRVLCAVNRGPWGVEALNAHVERCIRDRGHSTAETWYRGRPVLVTRNDYAIGLFNGDVGVCLPDDDGRMRVWFGAAGAPRPVVPARLPAHETAWAMTVHKSQGSELGHVVFVLPPSDSRLHTRELVYTALTRARERVTVFASADTLRSAILRRSERSSGLRALLAEPPAGE